MKENIIACYLGAILTITLLASLVANKTIVISIVIIGLVGFIALQLKLPSRTKFRGYSLKPRKETL